MKSIYTKVVCAICPSLKFKRPRVCQAALQLRQLVVTPAQRAVDLGLGEEQGRVDVGRQERGRRRGEGFQVREQRMRQKQGVRLDFWPDRLQK